MRYFQLSWTERVKTTGERTKERRKKQEMGKAIAILLLLCSTVPIFIRELFSHIMLSLLPHFLLLALSVGFVYKLYITHIYINVNNVLVRAYWLFFLGFCRRRPRRRYTHSILCLCHSSELFSIFFPPFTFRFYLPHSVSFALSPRLVPF